jgi:3-oxoacyl-[acyl-carrier-protein] synthase II
MAEVAITGIGLVTPLGNSPGEILDRILHGRQAIQPVAFAANMVCPMVAPVADFDAARYFPDNKTLRLMNRDAQMAVVAARLALEDAKIVPGALYPAEEIALYGATGLSGMPPVEIGSLVRSAAAEDGSLDLGRFGQMVLHRIRPVLSFKILANMPICFVSIFAGLRGPNAVYTPWEGQGAQAIAAGIRAVADGEVPCAVVGGCDVKTHGLSFLSLQQLGAFDSWMRYGTGSVPGEGAAFLVLEEHTQAARRGAKIYALVRGHSFGSIMTKSNVFSASNGRGFTKAEVLANVLRTLNISADIRVVAAGDGDVDISAAESGALENLGLDRRDVLRPKSHLGNLFAAAAAVQLALAATVAARQASVTPVLANCFGFGTEQAAFSLEGQ